MAILNKEILYDFPDVLIEPRTNNSVSRSEVILERTFKFYHSPKTWTGFPVMVANMDTTGTLAMGNVLANRKAITCLHKFYTVDEILAGIKGKEAYIWPSFGLSENDRLKLHELKDKSRALGFSPNLCLDVANGHTRVFAEFVAETRQMFPNSIIIAGNVVTPAGAEKLIDSGADIVKAGISRGGACATSHNTGVGYPQLSCVLNLSNHLHGLKSGDKKLGLLCSDGGCRETGDVCKAFGAGADFVMAGGMFSGCDENEGTWLVTYKKSEHGVCIGKTEKDNPGPEYKKIKLKFYGMSSFEAQDKYYGRKEHRGSEGQCFWVDAKGPAKDVLITIENGIRSCCTYIGADSIKDMSKCTTFNIVSQKHVPVS